VFGQDQEGVVLLYVSCLLRIDGTLTGIFPCTIKNVDLGSLYDVVSLSQVFCNITLCPLHLLRVLPKTLGAFRLPS